MHGGKKAAADCFFLSKTREGQHWDILSEQQHAVLVPCGGEASRKSSDSEEQMLLNVALSSPPLLGLQVRWAAQAVEKLG